MLQICHGMQSVPRAFFALFTSFVVLNMSSANLTDITQSRQKPSIAAQTMIANSSPFVSPVLTDVGAPNNARPAGPAMLLEPSIWQEQGDSGAS